MTDMNCSDAEEILAICKRIDSTAWAQDAEPDAYGKRRASSLAQAIAEWKAGAAYNRERDAYDAYIDKRMGY